MLSVAMQLFWAQDQSHGTFPHISTLPAFLKECLKMVTGPHCHVLMPKGASYAVVLTSAVATGLRL